MLEAAPTGSVHIAAFHPSSYALACGGGRGGRAFDFSLISLPAALFSETSLHHLAILCLVLGHTLLDT